MKSLPSVSHKTQSFTCSLLKYPHGVVKPPFYSSKDNHGQAEKLAQDLTANKCV